MRWFVLFLFFCGCSLKPGENLDSLFDAARDNLHTGELTKALAHADKGLLIAERNHDAIHQWRFRLLRCDILVMSRRPEAVLAELAEPMPETPAFAALAARRTMLEGQAQSMLGHASEAEGLLDKAHRAAEAAGAEDVVLDVEIIQGPIVGQLHGSSEAERILIGAMTRAHALHSAFSEANVLLNLGVIRMRMHHYDEAASLLEQASLLSGQASQVLYSVAQNNLAMCYLNLGEHDRAISIQKESIARNERAGAQVYLLDALGAIGESYLDKGELHQAIPYLLRSLGLASELNRTRIAAISAGNLASVYIELGDWRDAETLNAEAIRLKTSIKAHTLYYNVLNAAAIAAGKGDPDQAARLYRQVLTEAGDDPGALWSAREGLGVLADRQHDLPGAAREFEAAVEVLEQTRADLLRTEFKLPFLTRSIRLYQKYVDALLAQGQVERALAVADSSRAQVLAERSDAPPVRRLPPGAFSNLARQSGSVLLSYWLTPAQSHAWVVTAREIHHVTLPPAREIEALVASYQEAIERQLADPLRTRLPAAEKLYQILIAPVREFLPIGARVVVVPDGVLHGLNLESLPVPADPPHYWIQDVTLEIAPSLATWGRPSGLPNKRLLLLGDPVSSDPTFPPLTHAAEEIVGVKQNFAPPNQVVLTRESATPQAYLAAASGPFAAIHFTAHAIANRENPLESAVLLSGGKLYARDVMDLKLDTDLVTVSACRGAGLRTYSGEGLVGFAWAFLRAGARHVIAGLWDVNDQSTAGLMDVLYRELAAGKRPADALRAAKLAMIESRGNLRKPYYWAPFQLYTVTP